MAAALTVPTATRTNRPLTITGTGWALSTVCTCTLTSPNGSIQVVATSDGAGAVNFNSVLTWAPERPGRITVRVTDGASTVSQDVQVYSTT